MNIYGIPKPAYQAFEILHHLANQQLAVEGEHQAVDCWMFKKGRQVQILVIHFALPRHPVKKEHISFELNSLIAVTHCHIERIGEAHANPRQKWMDMGRPGSLSPADVQMLETVSALQKDPFSYTFQNDVVNMELDLIPQGIALITIETL